MELKYIVNKMVRSITYILPVDGEKTCWLVDCGDVEKVLEQGWKVLGVMLTHTHIDHIYGLNRLVEAFPDVVVYTNAFGKEGLVSPKLNFSKYHTDIENFVFEKPSCVRLFETEGKYVLDGGLEVEVLFTPGHEPSCLSFVVEDMVFTGDAYIKGEKTNTGFPKSNKQQAAESLERLMALERQGFRMMCGHPERKEEG